VSLLSRLFLLVAAALLPAIAIQAYNELDLRRSRQIEVGDQALGLAKLAAAEQQQMVQGIRQLLIALSELPAIKAKDSQACDAYLSEPIQEEGIQVEWDGRVKRLSMSRIMARRTKAAPVRA
jgi:hypothetical protein